MSWLPLCIPGCIIVRLHEDIADGKLVIIPDEGHFLPIDTPEAVAREIEAFI